jgi:hypothetical protein
MYLRRLSRRYTLRPYNRVPPRRTVPLCALPEPHFTSLSTDVLDCDDHKEVELSDVNTAYHRLWMEVQAVLSPHENARRWN